MHKTKTLNKRQPLIEDSPDISVILPFCNAENTLWRALISIQNQSFRNFECIAVDNCSTDRGAAMVKRMAREDPRFILAGESRRGVAPAFNRGAALARGHYLARMDADDVMRPDRLRLQHDFLERHPGYGAVGGKVVHRGTGVGRGGLEKYVEWNNGVLTYRQILNQRFVDAPVVNPSAMWRLETGKRLGHYRSGDFPEDYEMWLRWLHQGVQMAKVPEVVLDWYDSPGRLTRSHPAYSDDAFYRVKSRYLSLWLKENNPHHPGVAVWGASRISRGRARMLEEYGIRISCYIDIRRNRVLDKPLMFYRDLPEAGEMFILVYVRQWHAKDRIVRFLTDKGYVEGRDFLLVS